MAENITAKIQVRRGVLEDLPILAQGEIGYALDERRLFIGNIPITFIGDGTTTRFSIQDRTIISSHLHVTVNSLAVSPGIEYVSEGTNIIFATAPEAGATIIVSFNTEISTQRHVLDTNLASALDANVFTPRRLGVNFNLSNFNSAVFEYSLRTSNNSFKMGTIRLITDGNIVQVDDIATGINFIGIEFSAEIESNRVHLTYTNKTSETANFYYNIKLWNTI